jgi:hypothetical protein
LGNVERAGQAARSLRAAPQVPAWLFVFGVRILKADDYDRIRALADDTRAAYLLALKVFGQDGWDDPRMDEYNVFDPRR